MARFLIWRIGDFAENHQIKNPPILCHTLSLYAEGLAIAKFKICQCILMTDSPNLMLTKVSHYMVYLSCYLSYVGAGFHTGFLVCGGRSLWGTVTVSCMSAQHTHISVCVQARGIWGHAPPPGIFF